MDSRAPALTDDQCVRLFQGNLTTSALAELFVRHRKKVFFALQGFLFRAPEGRRTRTQETFRRPTGRYRAFRAVISRRGWTRIARNVCIDEWRRGRLDPVVENSELPKGLPGSPLEPSFELPSAGRAALGCDEGPAPEQRKCLELKIEGCSYEETARPHRFLRPMP